MPTHVAMTRSNCWLSLQPQRLLGRQKGRLCYIPAEGYAGGGVGRLKAVSSSCSVMSADSSAVECALCKFTRCLRMMKAAVNTTQTTNSTDPTDTCSDGCDLWASARHGLDSLLLCNCQGSLRSSAACSRREKDPKVVGDCNWTKWQACENLKEKCHSDASYNC
jgi:hypothetical protein